MVSVDSLALLATEPIRPGGHGEFRDGSVLKARVVAVLEANKARLAIAGQTIEVSTPIPLKAGMTLPVTVDNSGGSLKLRIQGDAGGRAQVPAARTMPPTPRASLDPFFAVEMAIAEALLSAETKLAALRQAPEQSHPETSPKMTERPAEGRPQTQAQAQTQTNAAHPASPKLPAAPVNPGAAPELPSPSSSDAAQPEQVQAANPPSAPPPSERQSAPLIPAPFYAPQLPYPHEARIERDKDDDEGDGGGKASAARGWTVSLSVDGGAMGLIHISVAYRANAVSVRLAAEEAQAAAELQTWLPELRAALQDADLAIDELSARQGDAFDGPVRGRSIIL
jgi:hypothetical protein